MNEHVVNFVNQFNYYNYSRSNVYPNKYIAAFTDLDTIEVFDYNDPLFFASVMIGDDGSRFDIEVSYGRKNVSHSFVKNEGGAVIPDCVYVTNKVNDLLRCIR